jgi:cytoskeletal protein RodZ
MSSEKAPKKKRKGLVIGLVVFASVLVIAGTVVFLGIKGIINIPGLTKQKPKPVVVKKKTPKVRSSKPIATPTQTRPRAIVSTEDPQQGAIKLAAVWNEMPAESLKPIIEDWNPTQCARVMNEMDSEKAAQALATLKPTKASAISKQMQALGSKKDLAESGN